ncbi:MAG: hypothetical protein P1U77_24140, partial [Rubripirellula sp.]|nr:hypothetical protein [Rubripirellula sp.]
MKRTAVYRISAQKTNPAGAQNTNRGDKNKAQRDSGIIPIESSADRPQKTQILARGDVRFVVETLDGLSCQS